MEPNHSNKPSGPSDSAARNSTSQPARSGGGMSPEDMADLLEIATYHVRQGAKDFTDFSKRMVDYVGEKYEDVLKPHLQELYDRVMRPQEDHHSLHQPRTEEGQFDGAPADSTPNVEAQRAETTTDERLSRPKDAATEAERETLGQPEVEGVAKQDFGKLKVEDRIMTKTQRIILAIGLGFIVALAIWPPFQYRGQYEGQHFLFDPAYTFARIDLTRLGIGWLSIVLVVAIVLLLHRVFSPRAIKILGLTVVAMILITAAVILVIRSTRENARRQVYAALIRHVRDDLSAVTVSTPSFGQVVLSNPTKWALYGASTVDCLTTQRVILFSDNSSASLRRYGQDTLGNDSLRFLSDWQKRQLPPKKPFIQRVTVRYSRAARDDQTVELDPAFEIVSERYFVFYPEEWGWDEMTQTSYLRGPAEFKEVSSSTQSAPSRRLAGPPVSRPIDPAEFVPKY